MNATCVLKNENPKCCCDGPTVPPISEGQCPTSGCGKIAISQSRLQSHTRSGDVAISNARINARIRYDNLAHVSDGCRQKYCI